MGLKKGTSPPMLCLWSPKDSRYHMLCTVLHNRALLSPVSLAQPVDLLDEKAGGILQISP